MKKFFRKIFMIALCCVLPLSAMAAPSPREIWNYKKGDVTRFLKYDHLSYGVLDDTPFAWTMIIPNRDCNSGNIAAIRAMLQVDSNLANSRRFNPSDGTVLFIPANNCCINKYDTCTNNMAEIAEILLDYGADVNALGNPDHDVKKGPRTPLAVLHEATQVQTCDNKSVCEKIEQMLLERGAVSAYNNDTPTQNRDNTNTTGNNNQPQTDNNTNTTQNTDNTNPNRDNNNNSPEPEHTVITTITVNGKVMDTTTNKPLAGATVTVLDRDGKTLNPPITTKTDKKGNFKLSNVPNDAQIQVTYNNQTTTSNADKNITINLAIPSAPTSSNRNTNLTAVIKIKSGAPASGAIVTALDKSGKPLGESAKTTTDSDGRFTLENIPKDGKIEIQYSDKATTTDVKSVGKEITFPINLITKTGRVIDTETKKPLSGVNVEGLRNNNQKELSLIPRITTTTDDDGNFTLDNIPEKAKIKASYQGKSRVISYEKTTQTPIIINLPITPKIETNAITGKILSNATAEPLSGVTVTALNAKKQPIGDPIITTSDGEFKFNQAHKNGFIQAKYQNIEKTLPVTPEMKFVLELQPTMTVHGKIVQTGSQEPLNGADVAATNPANHNILLVRQHGSTTETILAKADENGEFTMTDVPTNCKIRARYIGKEAIVDPKDQLTIEMEITNRLQPVIAQDCTPEALKSIHAINAVSVKGKCLALECEHDKQYYITPDPERICKECSKCTDTTTIDCTVTSQDTFQGKLRDPRQDELNVDPSPNPIMEYPYPYRININKEYDFSTRYKCTYAKTCKKGYGHLSNEDKDSPDGSCTPQTYTITYKNVENYTADPTEYTFGSGATIQGTPTKDGYTFSGWCTDEHLQNCAMTQTIGTDATGNQTFYAKWTANTYKIVYFGLDGVTSNGQSQQPQTYTYGTTVTAKTPTKQNEQFVGWFRDNGYTFQCDGDTIILENDIGDQQRYAKWSSCLTQEMIDKHVSDAEVDKDGNCVPTNCHKLYKLVPGNPDNPCVLKHTRGEPCNNQVSKDDPDFKSSGGHPDQITEGTWETDGDRWKCKATQCADGFVPNDAGECVPDKHKIGDECGPNDPPIDSRRIKGAWRKDTKNNNEWFCYSTQCVSGFNAVNGICDALPPREMYFSPFDKLKSFMNQNFSEKASAWKNYDDTFNTKRLVSDSAASVVLGTIGGVVTSNIVKKNQVQQGFEQLKCVIGGQPVATWGDEFTVKVY